MTFAIILAAIGSGVAVANSILAAKRFDVSLLVAADDRRVFLHNRSLATICLLSHERNLPMFKTKNDLSEAIRTKTVELLNARLADAVDLQTQTKQAHWNVKGPNFIALHELFDEVNGDVAGYVDEIAERAVQLGGVAEGTARSVAQRSSLGEYPANAVDGRSHVEALSSALAAFGKSARSAIDQANEFGDLDTADLFTEVSRGIDKWLWFVEAHLQSER